MTVRMANQITRTGAPMYCSACFGQDITLRHVDFDAACDRGYGGEDHTISMDDLVLCETCLRYGATLVGMVDAEENANEIANLKRTLKREHYRAEEIEAYAAALELAVDSRPEKIIKPRQTGRPRVMGRAEEDE